MVQTVFPIGIHSSELRWVRMLVNLLRHPDPNVAELTRQALLYLSESASRRSDYPSQDLDRSDAGEEA